MLCSASSALSELKYWTRAVPLYVEPCSTKILHSIIGPKGRNNSYSDLLFVWLGRFFIWRIPAWASGSGLSPKGGFIFNCNLIPALKVTPFSSVYARSATEKKRAYMWVYIYIIQCILYRYLPMSLLRNWMYPDAESFVRFKCILFKLCDILVVLLLWYKSCQLVTL